MFWLLTFFYVRVHILGLLYSIFEHPRHFFLPVVSSQFPWVWTALKIRVTSNLAIFRFSMQFKIWSLYHLLRQRAILKFLFLVLLLGFILTLVSRCKDYNILLFKGNFWLLLSPTAKNLLRSTSAVSVKNGKIAGGRAPRESFWMGGERSIWASRPLQLL